MPRKKKKRVAPGQWLKQRKTNIANNVDTIIGVGKPRKNQVQEQWIVPDDRKIIPVYDYKRGSASRDYLITDHGEVISCADSTPTRIKTKFKDKYEHFTMHKETYYIQRCVWFSFAYYWIKNPSEVEEPLAFEKITSKEQLDKLRKAKVPHWDSKTRKTEYRAKYQVHHQDSDRLNNCYSNLVLEDESHEVLTKIKIARELAEANGKTVDKAILMLIHMESKSSTAVYYKGNKTRTEKINLTVEKWENEKKSSDVTVKVNQGDINEIILTAYAHTYKKTRRKDTIVLYWIYGIPAFAVVRTINKKQHVFKYDHYTKDVDLNLGDITDMLMGDIATENDKEDFKKITNLKPDHIQTLHKEDL